MLEAAVIGLYKVKVAIKTDRSVINLVSVRLNRNLIYTKLRAL